MSRQISATELKAKCLVLLDDLARNGGTVTVFRRGVAVASIGPARQAKYPSPEGRWAAKFPSLPVLEPDEYDLTWDADH